MNFFSWDKAFSLYPWATFMAFKTLAFFRSTDPESRFSKARTKYEQRGYQFIDSDFEDVPPACAFNKGPRRVGDWRSWVMVLDTRGVSSSKLYAGLPLNFDPNFVNCWELETKDEDRLVDYREDNQHLYYTTMRMRCSVLENLVLRYDYTLSHSRFRHVKDFIDTCERVERRGLPDEAREEIESMPETWFKIRQMKKDKPSLHLYVS